MLPHLNIEKTLKTLLNILSRDPSSAIHNGHNIQVNQTSLVEKLYLNNWSALSDPSLLYIGERCPELRQLELRNCTEVTNAGIQAIATLCTSLDHLDLSGKPYDPK